MESPAIAAPVPEPGPPPRSGVAMATPAESGFTTHMRRAEAGQAHPPAVEKAAIPEGGEAPADVATALPADPGLDVTAPAAPALAAKASALEEPEALAVAIATPADSDLGVTAPTEPVLAAEVSALKDPEALVAASATPTPGPVLPEAPPIPSARAAENQPMVDLASIEPQPVLAAPAPLPPPTAATLVPGAGKDRLPSSGALASPVLTVPNAASPTVPGTSVSPGVGATANLAASVAPVPAPAAATDEAPVGAPPTALSQAAASQLLAATAALKQVPIVEKNVTEVSVTAVSRMAASTAPITSAGAPGATSANAVAPSEAPTNPARDPRAKLQEPGLAHAPADAPSQAPHEAFASEAPPLDSHVALHGAPAAAAAPSTKPPAPMLLATLPVPLALAEARPPAPPVPPARQLAPLAAALAFQTRDGETNALSVALDPGELGRVEISVERSGGNIAIRVTVERAETLALLQRDQRELSQSLDQAGGGEGGRSISFSLSGQGGGQRQGQASPGQHGTAPPWSSAAEARASPMPDSPRPRNARSLLDLAI
jgi:flagellar hook-length control protein FliK